MSSPVEPNLKQDLENWANAKEIKFYWRADLVELKYYSYNFILAFVVWYIVSAFFWLKAQKMPWTFPFAEFFFYQMLGLVVGWVIGYFKPLRRLILIRSYREKNLKREVALMTSELGANVFWSSSEKMGILVLKRENTEVENVVFSESELQKVKEKGEKYFSVK
jgi:uncharacterized membrane protein YciS (DUF1049 family)